MRDLARKATMDYTYLSKIENSRMPPPKEDVIQRLATVLGADLNELLALAGKTPPVLEETLKSESARRFLFRHAPNLTDADWDRLLSDAEKDSKDK